MFTGIVTHIGTVSELDLDSDHSIRIDTPTPQQNLEIGASIACDGVCLTIVEIFNNGSGFKVNVSQETLECTSIGKWKKGQRVNLERSLRVGDELGGHIVSGHIDGVAQIEKLDSLGDNFRLTCQPPSKLFRFLATKGSVTLNGVSLTINEVNDTSFTVNLIPHTMAVTNWGTASKGDWVNIEIDVIARYISRFQEVGQSS